MLIWSCLCPIVSPLVCLFSVCISCCLRPVSMWYLWPVGMCIWYSLFIIAMLWRLCVCVCVCPHVCMIILWLCLFVCVSVSAYIYRYKCYCHHGKRLYSQRSWWCTRWPLQQSMAVVLDLLVLTLALQTLQSPATALVRHLQDGCLPLLSTLTPTLTRSTTLTPVFTIFSFFFISSDDLKTDIFDHQLLKSVSVWNVTWCLLFVCSQSSTPANRRWWRCTKRKRRWLHCPPRTVPTPATRPRSVSPASHLQHRVDRSAFRSCRVGQVSHPRAKRRKNKVRKNTGGWLILGV